MEETYRFEVLTGGQVLIYKDKQARPPVIFNKVLKKDLPLLEVQCRRLSLKYKITNESEIAEKEIKEDVFDEVSVVSEKVEVEPKKINRRTILGKLLSDSSEK